MDQQPRVRHNMEFLAGLVGQYQPENYKQGAKVKAIWIDISRQYSQELGLPQPVNYKLLLQAWKNKKQYAKKKAKKFHDNPNTQLELDPQTQLMLSVQKKPKSGSDVEIVCLPDSEAYLQDSSMTSDPSDPEQTKNAQETSDSIVDTSVTSASQSVTSAPSISIAKPITRPYVTKMTYPAESTNNVIDDDRPNLLKSKLMESMSRGSHLHKIQELELKKVGLEVKILEAKERAARADERAALAREQEALVRVQIVKLQLKQAQQAKI